MLPTFGSECLDRTERESRKARHQLTEEIRALVAEIKDLVTAEEFADWKTTALLSAQSNELPVYRRNLIQRIAELTGQKDPVLENWVNAMRDVDRVANDELPRSCYAAAVKIEEEAASEFMSFVEEE